MQLVAEIESNKKGLAMNDYHFEKAADRLGTAVLCILVLGAVVVLLANALVAGMKIVDLVSAQAATTQIARW